MLDRLGFKSTFLLGWLSAISLLLVLAISGCGGSRPAARPALPLSPTPTPAPAPRGKVYVSNTGANSIVRFDNALGANGNVAPAAVISGAATQLNAPAHIFLDPAADRLYVADRGNLAILIFDNISTKTGNVAPERVISGAATTLVSPTDVSVDKVRDLLYVADDTKLAVFSAASTSSGNVAPARVYTAGFAISAMFLDGANDRVYLADRAGKAIGVYDNASTLAAGPVTANRIISGAATALGTPSGIQIDGLGRLVVSNASPPSITIYNNAATANGNVAPTAEITGSSTLLTTPAQIVVDPTGTGTLYTADPGLAAITIFANLSSATGNDVASRVVSGSATTLTVAGQPAGVALDTTR